ncbi:MAG: glutaredoxin [Lentimonas sp.]|jgi:glutaredoxin
MKVPKKPVLYVKANCSRCREVLSFFDSQGVDFEVLDVSANKRNMDAMVSVSKQTEVPTFEYEDFIVAKFSIDEFLAELREFPEISQQIGIGNDAS